MPKFRFFEVSDPNYHQHLRRNDYCEFLPEKDEFRIVFSRPNKIAVITQYIGKLRFVVKFLDNPLFYEVNASIEHKENVGVVFVFELNLVPPEHKGRMPVMADVFSEGVHLVGFDINGKQRWGADEMYDDELPFRVLSLNDEAEVHIFSPRR